MGVLGVLGFGRFYRGYNRKAGFSRKIHKSSSVKNPANPAHPTRFLISTGCHRLFFRAGCITAPSTPNTVSCWVCWVCVFRAGFPRLRKNRGWGGASCPFWKFLPPERFDSTGKAARICSRRPSVPSPPYRPNILAMEATAPPLPSLAFLGFRGGFPAGFGHCGPVGSSPRNPPPWTT